MANPKQGTLLLTRGEVAGLLDLETCIEAVERAFRLQGEWRTTPPAMMGLHVPAGGFHTKGGILELDRPYFAAKTNANFMQNRARNGLPSIQGTLVLHDAENGFPLAVMDSIEISVLRTGAATAVAAKHLARRDSRVIAVAGCGEQGHVQLQALSRVRHLERAMVWDLDPARAAQLAARLAPELGIEIVPVERYARAARTADLCVTCTPSQEFILDREDVRPGTFVAGVGVDNPHKKELSPALLAGSTIVVDSLAQCLEIGDLHHAISAGVLTAEAVHAELGAVVAGVAPGRTREDEITVFDSTGMALQDVAAAVVVYERALAAGGGRFIDFGG